MIDRLMTIDRRFIFLCLAIAAIVPIMKPVGLPILESPESRDFLTELQAVKSGETIIFSFDYEADTRAELDPMSVAVWRYCLENDIRIITLTNYAGGPGIAEAVYRQMQEEQGAVYGEDFVFLGYNPDYQGTMLRMGESIRATFPTDQYGKPIDEIPMMEGIDTYADIPLVVSIAASALAEYWAIFAGGQYGQKVITGNTAIQAILVYPYYNTKQISGFLGGLKGAAELETMLGKPDAAARGMDSQSAVHVLIVVFILIGNIGFLLQRRRTGRGDV